MGSSKVIGGENDVPGVGVVVSTTHSFPLYAMLSSQDQG